MPENPFGLDHFVHLQGQGDVDNWLARHVHRYPSAEERLLSFVGEVIRQADKELPADPNSTMVIPPGGREVANVLLFRYLYQHHKDFLKAAGACRNDMDWQEITGEARGWLEDPDRFNNHLSMVPTLAGRLWYEEQTRQVYEKKQGFIAMWFPSSESACRTVMEKVRQAMEEAIAAAGYTPYCVITDDSISEGIDDEIIAQMRRSRFLIADLTDEAGNQGRRNVYYEAGFAYGQELEIFYTCQEEHFEENGAAFDIQQRDILQWDVNREEGLDEFRQRLWNCIEARLGVGPIRQAPPT